MAGRTLRVYGTVPFLSLLNGRERAHTTPSLTFTYVISAYSSKTAFTVERSPCRSVHIDFLPDADVYNGEPGGQGTASLVQETADPVSRTVPGRTVGVLDAEVVPGRSWAMNIDQTGTQFGYTWYINGTASCYERTFR